MKFLSSYFLLVFVGLLTMFHVEPLFAEGETIVGYQGTVGEIFAWGIAIFTGISAILSALSNLMIFISKKTETKKDDKWAGWLSKGALWAGKIVGWLNSPKIKKPPTS